MRGILFISLILALQTVQAQEVPRYSCLLDRTDVNLWLNDTLHQFDEKGIIIQDNEYHPVSICQYGLLCLDKFERTKDRIWLKRATDQVEFFSNPNRVHILFDGEGIGLSYNFEYKGLTPPWYSGMAQGMAISFLLRFSVVAQDTSIHDVVKKIAFVLTQTEESGGCLSRTPENLLWIEEYPNSTQSPQVLNGAVFGLFGLMDYCGAFPEASREHRIMIDCIKALKTSLPIYDSRGWTRYNRRKVYPNRFDYIHLQIFQMRQLYDYLKDPLYLRQACIWAAMINGKTDEKQKDIFLFTEQDIAIPATLSGSSISYNLPEDQLNNRYESIRINSNGAKPLPWYAFATSETVEISEKKKLTISLDSTLAETHVFFRYHWDNALFEQEKWQAENAVSASNHTFYLQPGTYQFAIFATPETSSDSIDVYQFELSDWISEE